MISVSGFKTKKSLKEFVGNNLYGRVVETSMFNIEFTPPVRGLAVVGPSPYVRKWYAQIWTDADGVLTKVT